jgi:hypothetical protein
VRRCGHRHAFLLKIAFVARIYDFHSHLPFSTNFHQPKQKGVGSQFGFCILCHGLYMFLVRTPITHQYLNQS